MPTGLGGVGHFLQRQAAISVKSDDPPIHADTQRDDDAMNECVDESSTTQTDDDQAQHVSLRIRRQLPNARIDKYLRHRFSDFSRNVLQRLISEQAVTVNGRPTKSSYQLKPGDRIDLILPPPETDEIPGEPIPLEVIYEDDAIIVINKQEDLIVHPARGAKSGTLVNGLVHYSNALSSVNGSFRPGIVHRLDRNTTGVILIAKTDTAHWRLAHQFEHRLVQKEYLAIVQGTMQLDADEIDVPLGRHPRIREKFAASPVAGKEAVTRYQRLEQFRGYALVRLMPKTGRTHQLRVHMSLIKHPIAGDIMYGGKAMTVAQLAEDRPLPSGDEPGADIPVDALILDHQALHAAQITIRHPITAESMTFEAPMKDKMALLLNLLQRYRRVL